MKKIIKSIFVALFAASLFTACSNYLENTSDNSASRAVVADADRTCTVKAYLFGAPSGTWNIWAWRKSSPEANYSKNDWPGGDIVLSQDDTLDALSKEFAVDPNYSLGLLFVKSSGSPQTSDITVKKDLLTDGVNLYFIYGETKVYTNPADCIGLRTAAIASADGDKIECTIIGYASVDETMFTVEDSEGTGIAVTGVTKTGTTVVLTLESGNLSAIPYKVTFTPDEETEPYEATAGLVSTFLDQMGFTYDGNDLGVKINGSLASFKMWSPMASEVNLLLYANATDAKSTNEDKINERVAMSMDSATGVWSVEDVDFGTNTYYKYEIKTYDSDKAVQVADIWSYSAAPNSVASQIIDINYDSETMPEEWEASYVNPFGSTGTETKSYSDAVIYEMHVRDWSRAVVSDSTGKYLDLANSDDFMNHLKDIGVTHVQILPVFDHAETNNSTAYNWGYNPYHYNVPEGRYVTKDYTEGSQAVKEFRTLIQKLHENGIAVIMDVVYNHTSGTGSNSLYDKTCEKYFYRLTSNGTYSNGSGCGNELATNHIMVKKYVIDSLKHWMNDYHINGFRFDLMGCLEADTMKDIYDTLYEIDNNVMVYGEPWTGGTCAVEDGAVAAGRGTNGLGYGAFDDDFRDAIKGAEFGGFQKGHIQGTYKDAGIVKGLKGLSGSNNRNTTGIPALSLHYVECHDNYTLFDKLAISYLGKTSFSGDLFEAIGTKGLEEVKKQDKLAAAYVILSQGTPFLNGGQEFLRTKKGNENSYNAADAINQIDLSFKETYSDVYNTYRGLIALRKDYSAFRNASSVEAETLSTGVTKYSVTDSNASFVVYYNASSSDVSISDSGKLVSVEKSSLVNNSGILGAGFANIDSEIKPYSIGNSEVQVSKVPAKSFMIIKK